MKRSKICKFCNLAFTKPMKISKTQWRARIFCSTACRDSAKRFPRITIKCKICGNQFQSLPSEHRKFCSQTCAFQGRKLPYPAHLVNNAQIRKKAAKARRRRKIIKCEQCNTSFEVVKSSFQRFCSRHCKDRWWSEHRIKEKKCSGCGLLFKYSSTKARQPRYCNRECYFSHIGGPANPNWKGGPIPYYGPHWDKIAAEIRKRDLVCQHCGMTPEQNGVALDVHHIILIRKFNKDFKRANNPTNLIALCKRCHVRCHTRRNH